MFGAVTCKLILAIKLAQKSNKQRGKCAMGILLHWSCSLRSSVEEKFKGKVREIVLTPSKGNLGTRSVPGPVPQ